MNNIFATPPPHLLAQRNLFSLDANLTFTLHAAGCTSYGVPFALKAATPSEQFVRGPIHLGAFSRPFNFMACMYLLFICSIAVLTTDFPITMENLNYAPVAYGIFLIIALFFW